MNVDDEINLTLPEQINNNLCMRGRVLTYQQCPVCQRPFTVLPDEKGIICPEHKTVPTRYYINANQLKAGRLYSDPQGNPFDSYKVALRQLESMRRDHDARILNPDNWKPKIVKAYRFEILIDEWLRGYDLEVAHGAKAEAYVKKLKQYIRDYLKQKFIAIDIREIREPQIKSFYHDLLEKNLSHKTIKHILNTLKTFMSAHKNIIKIVPDFPVFTITPKREKKWLGIEKQYAVLICVPQQKDRLALELLFDTGMRPGELRALKKSDLMDGCITVSRAFSETSLRLRTKTGAIETHRLSFSLWEKLVEHTKDMTGDDFLFTDNGFHIFVIRDYQRQGHATAWPK